MTVVPFGGAHLPSAVVRHVRSDWPLAALDVCLITLGWLAAWVVTNDASHVAWSSLWTVLPLVVPVTVLCQAIAHLYTGVWRFASVREARLVVLAQAAALCVIAPTLVLVHNASLLGTALVASVFGTALVGGVRFQSRLFAFRRHGGLGPALIVIGAGNAGISLAREIAQDEEATVVAFLDKSQTLQGRHIQGVRVQGTLEDLPEVARLTHATHAVLAIRSATSELIRQAAALADEAGVVLRVLPPVTELVNGNALLADVRDLEIADLLGRDQIDTDLSAIVSLVQGRRVLVTGAGGSIGSEIARQVAGLGAARVTLVDHDETHLFDAAADLPPSAVQRLADVRETEALRRVFESERPQIVFHAAAHKHVPLLEGHPVEAVYTNILGTRNVVQAARDVGVERFVFISTDKAVRPSSVMGASKAVGEQVVRDQAGAMTVCAVRFGNVLGSRGSVVPTFVKQIRAGGPVTITDGRMTRYFMSIPEAVRLVLHAAALARGGEVFMLEMGDPVAIRDLAARMIKLSGRRPGLDVEIRVTGIRPGEKLAEQLHTSEERQHRTEHPSIVRLDTVPVDSPRLGETLHDLTAAVESRDDQAARSRLWDHLGAPAVISIPAQESVGRHVRREPVVDSAGRAVAEEVSWI